jgi:hypothetical protein
MMDERVNAWYKRNLEAKEKAKNKFPEEDMFIITFSELFINHENSIKVLKNNEKAVAILKSLEERVNQDIIGEKLKKVIDENNISEDEFIIISSKGKILDFNGDVVGEL